METNGAEKEKSLIRQAAAQFSDHLELAALEWSYEKRQGVRVLAALGIAVFLAFFAFALLQVALLHVLMASGLSLGISCLILSSAYAALAAGVYIIFGRRDPRAGAPFEATRREAKETIQWIQKIF